MVPSLFNTISYGKTVIAYELLITNRKTLEITVHPTLASIGGARVVVKAPATSDMQAIEDKVKKRVRWIKKQIAYFNQFAPRTPARRYVGGESHLYLGRKYRLKIEKATCDSILLKNGYFTITSTTRNSVHIKNLLAAWYLEHANIYLTQVFEECWNGFSKKNLTKPTLKIQAMKKRWGSLSVQGRLTLNIRLIQAPRESIEYVIMHELCHLLHHNHSAKFYARLDRTMPDWIKRKHKLEMLLA